MQTSTMAAAPAVMPNWADVESGLTRLLARLNTLIEASINRIQAMGGEAVRQVAAPAAVAVSLASPAIPAPVVNLPNRPTPIVSPVSLPTPAMTAAPVTNPLLPAPTVIAPVPSPERDRPQVPNSALWGGDRQPRESAGPDLRPLLRSIRLEGEAGRIQRRVESVGDRAGRILRNPDRELRQTGISIANREIRRIRPVRMYPSSHPHVAFRAGVV